MSAVLLVVDSDPMTEQVIRRTYSSTRVSIVFARTPREALDYFKPVSVVLCAQHIGEFDGYKLAGAISESHPSAALFIVSPGAGLYDPAKGRLAGAIGSLTKPLTEQQLHLRLDEFLTQGSIVNPMVPAMQDRLARLVRYSDGLIDQDNVESLIRELLPPVVEKVLLVQMAHNPHFKSMLERIVREVVSKAVSEKLQLHQSNTEDLND